MLNNKRRREEKTYLHVEEKRIGGGEKQREK
jgi:hypothetical protein